MPSIARMSAAGLVAVLVASLAGVASADDVKDRKRDADKRIASLNTQLEGTNAKLATAYVELEKTKAALPGAQQRVQQALAAQTRAEEAAVAAENTRLRAVDAEAKAKAYNDEVAQRLAVAQAKEARAKEQLAKSTQDLNGSKDALDAYAASVFQGGGQQSQLGFMFGDTTPGQLADNLTMADTASNIAADTIDAWANKTADSTATQSYLTSVRGEIATLKKQAEKSLADAQSATQAATAAKTQADVARNNAVTAKANAVAAQNQLTDLQGRQVSWTNALAEQKKNEKADLAEAQKESADMQAILNERARLARIAEQKRQAKIRAEKEKKRQQLIAAEKAKAEAARKKGQTYKPKNPPPVVDTPDPPSSGAVLAYPAYGPTTSGFGMRWHPVLQKWMLHDGLDWGIACGTPVRASADGVIVRAGWRPSGWGNQVMIDHGIHRGVDVVTTYNHLSSIVKFGGTVKRGQLIGYSGTTGYSTGCHLHFGVYTDGTPVNPRNWL